MNIVSVADNLWVARQPLRFLGVEIGTRMTVVRLSNNDFSLLQILCTFSLRLTTLLYLYPDSPV
ncbi:hypothetical protein N836_00465 [Leptolyngbya sp. Heron Island J]|uniref:hypothetical protein n=1 Tax=Leptolyngbya sp. Heron Island J TaxID=1385935 RepID=UPI0003B9A84E|nr:hypothetical protein [Leptolyngbya sp. Heron Island J]ESA36379.1 hypothetical protein N836_00465 [Leptolyngbya sp. Heron Island J]